MTKTLADYLEGKIPKPRSIIEEIREQIPDEWSVEIEITKGFVRMIVYDQDGEQFDYKDLTSNTLENIYEAINSIKRQL